MGSVELIGQSACALEQLDQAPPGIVALLGFGRRSISERDTVSGCFSGAILRSWSAGAEPSVCNFLHVCRLHFGNDAKAFCAAEFLVSSDWLGRSDYESEESDSPFSSS